jgi:hypothetical protein
MIQHLSLQKQTEKEWSFLLNSEVVLSTQQEEERKYSRTQKCSRMRLK